MAGGSGKAPRGSAAKPDIPSKAVVPLAGVAALPSSGAGLDEPVLRSFPLTDRRSEELVALDVRPSPVRANGAVRRMERRQVD
jgi:hypothetical protein